jgi:hypothetical protein
MPPLTVCVRLCVRGGRASLADPPGACTPSHPCTHTHTHTHAHTRTHTHTRAASFQEDAPSRASQPPCAIRCPRCSHPRCKTTAGRMRCAWRVALNTRRIRATQTRAPAPPVQRVAEQRVIQNTVIRSTHPCMLYLLLHLSTVLDSPQIALGISFPMQVESLKSMRYQGSNSLYAFYLRTVCRPSPARRTQTRASAPRCLRSPPTWTCWAAGRPGLAMRAPP